MSDIEIVKLKKEIQLLREHNAQLKIQLEEQSLQLGELERRNLNIMNQNLMYEEEQKISSDSAKLQKLIENALSEEKAETEKYKMQAGKLSNQVQLYVQKIKEYEIYIQKLQQDNSRLKKDLLDFGENMKHRII